MSFPETIPLLLRLTNREEIFPAEAFHKIVKFPDAA